jgi:putative ABC transport system permease protein
MTAAPVLRAASGGITRRLVQTTVVFVVLAASTAAALLGVTLLTNANELFYHAVAAQHGADLAVTIDAARVSPAQLAATRRAAGVTQAAGPYPETTVTLAAGPAAGGSGLSIPGLSVVGRASHSGPLDELTLNQGRWATRPGEIDLAIYQPFQVPLGSTVTVSSAPGKPALTVVGYAGSVVRDEDAWVAPGQVAALRPRAAPGSVQMLYTFAKAGTGAQVTADLTAVRRVLPAGAVTGSVSWLPSADQTGAEQSVNTAFVVAFALIGLALAGLIVANVVSGAVLAGYRRIGVLKSIGFTPAQVATAYVAQLGIPTVAGCAAGAALGNYWVLPELNNSAGAFHAAHQTVPLWINVTVPLGMCLLVGLAALVPALRAGRLSATAALAAGPAQRPGHGYTAHRLAGRLALPRPVSIGLAAPFSRPAWSATMLAAITFGLAAVVLAVGLDGSLAAVNGSAVQGAGQVQVDPAGRQATFTASQVAAITAALRAQPGTRRYVAEADLVPFPGAHPTVTVPGVGPVPVTAYAGPSGWLGWTLVSGRWYHGPGEVDVNSAFLTQAGLTVGDRISLRLGGRAIPARIVGQVFDLGGAGLLTGWPTLGGAAAGLTAGQYDIGLRPGTSPQAYTAALTRALGRGVFVGVPRAGAPGFELVDTSYIRVLTILMAVLAGLGVLNSVLLVTRERVHDLGVFKAVGMTPRQTLAMVTCWVVVPAIGAAVLALPGGMLLQDVTVRALANDIGLPLPGQFIHVYGAVELLLLALAGLGIAAAGALLPAGWAAASRTAAALRAE